LNRVLRESRLQKPCYRRRGKAPIISPALVIVPADLTDSRHSRQDHAAWFQNALNVSDGGAQIENELQRLRQNDAVEAFRFDGIGSAQVRNNRGTRIPRLEMENMGTAHTFAAESLRLLVIFNFQHVPANVRRML